MKLDELNGQNYILGHGRATLEEIVAEISKGASLTFSLSHEARR